MKSGEESIPLLPESPQHAHLSGSMANPLGGHPEKHQDADPQQSPKSSQEQENDRCNNGLFALVSLIAATPGIIGLILWATIYNNFCSDDRATYCFCLYWTTLFAAVTAICFKADPSRYWRLLVASVAICVWSTVVLGAVRHCRLR